MSQKPRVVPISPAPGRARSGRVVRPDPNSSARGDEPTRVAPLEYAPGQSMMTAREQREEPEVAAPQPVRASRITRAPASREEIGGHYSVQNPEHGTTSVLPPRATSSAPPPSKSGVFGAADQYFEAAELLLQRGDCRRAVLAAQQGMKIAPPRPAQQALYAWLLYERDGRGVPIHPHVFRHLDQALFRDPECVDAHCFKGVLLARLGHSTEALAHLRRALELDPDHLPAARALQLVYEQIG
jgi:tetratricopeptide (TPR) repeat protein